MKLSLFLHSILCGSVLFLSSCSTLFYHDQRKPPATLFDFSPTTVVQTLWSNHESRGAAHYDVRLSPAVIDQKVFVTETAGRVIAIDAHTGSTVWTVDTKSSLASGVGVSQDRVFVATETGEVLSLQQKEGTQVWRTPVGNQILAAPVVAHGMVFVKTIDGVLVALSQSEGRELWRYTEESPSLILHLSSQPQVVGDRVVVGFANGKLVVLKRKEGTVVWEKKVATPHGTTAIERMIDIDVTPHIAQGVIYTATYQGNLTAFSLENGQQLWEHKISSNTGLIVDHDQVYITDTAGQLWAFNARTGRVVWRNTQLLNRGLTAPVFQGKYIVVGDAQGYMHWLSRQEGHFVARMPTDRSGINASPVVRNNILYVSTRRGNVFAFKTP